MAGSASITVPGASGTAVTLSAGKGDVLGLAAQIGALLSSVQGAGNLSQTTVSLPGAIPSIVTVKGALRGPHTDYIIAGNGGSVYVSDKVPGRDGAQSVSGDTVLTFSDGVGLYDPTGTAENVSRLYRGLLNRAASIDELKFWTALIDNSHASLAAVAGAFASSSEFHQLYGSLSDADFINKAYQNTLGRPADDADLQGWGARLAAGTSRGDVGLAITQSLEAKYDSLGTAGDNNNGEIYRIYEAAFARAPDVGGMSYWSSLLANGATVKEVAAAIATNSEFQTNDASLNVSDFVTRMYLEALHRAPDSDGLRSWSAAIQGGESRANVLLDFADSVESRALTADATHANWVFIPSSSGPSTPELFLSGLGGLNASVPGGYNYIVVNDATADTVTATNSVILANSVGGTFFVSGNSTVAATGGNNTVNATGTYALSFGAGNNLVIASGSGTIATGLGASTVVAANTSGSGNVIDSNGTGDLVNAVFGNNTVNAAGSNSTIAGGFGGLTVSVTGSNDLIVGGAGSAMTIKAGSGSSGLLVNAGAAALTFVGGAATATILGGSAGSTIFGSSNSNVTFGGPGHLSYDAASAGNDTLNAATATGNVNVSLRGGADSIILGSGSDTLTAGAGAATLDGGSGANQYFFDHNLTPAATAFIVTELANNVANDIFNFKNYRGIDPLVTSTAGQPVVLQLSDNTTITFAHVTDPLLIHTQNI